MEIPVIDFAAYDGGRPETIKRLGLELDAALSQSGFLSVINLGVSGPLLKDVFAASRAFFAGDHEDKMASAYRSAAENFGYQALGHEHLDPAKPADLKESFTLRDVSNHAAEDARWPSPDFRVLMQRFYSACLEGAYRLQRVLAEGLALEREYFVRRVSGENCALRLLHYPTRAVQRIHDAQMGAAAHSDYGLLTLLFQDDVGGLEVFGAEGTWQPISHREGAIVVNAGDMLERWSNGRYPSTLHRVQPQTGTRERYSIAMFVDPDSETPIEALESCVSDERPVRFPPTTAGEHLLQRLQASQRGGIQP